MKKLIITLMLLGLMANKTTAQTAEVKVNVLSAALAIFNPSLEVGFNSHSAITLDYVGVFAKYDYYNTGYPFLLSMGSMGYRYYIKSDTHNGAFVGADLGFNTFVMSKNIIPIVGHTGTDFFDIGCGTFMGTTLGYKLPINERWGTEFSISGGWQHSWHELYNFDGTLRTPMNASGEWLFYKAAISLTYKLF
ncbi:MAG: DUF3575 domain-containing protein [Rikenellaceae bacterium]